MLASWHSRGAGGVGGAGGSGETFTYIEGVHARATGSPATVTVTLATAPLAGDILVSAIGNYAVPNPGAGIAAAGWDVAVSASFVWWSTFRTETLIATKIADGTEGTSIEIGQSPSALGNGGLLVYRPSNTVTAITVEFSATRVNTASTPVALPASNYYGPLILLAARSRNDAQSFTFMDPADVILLSGINSHMHIAGEAQEIGVDSEALMTSQNTITSSVVCIISAV